VVVVVVVVVVMYYCYNASPARGERTRRLDDSKVGTSALFFQLAAVLFGGRRTRTIRHNIIVTSSSKIYKNIFIREYELKCALKKKKSFYLMKFYLFCETYRDEMQTLLRRRVRLYAVGAYVFEQYKSINYDIRRAIRRCYNELFTERYKTFDFKLHL